MVVILLLAGFAFDQCRSAQAYPAASQQPPRFDAARPNGDALFRESFRAMAKSLHALHSEASVRQDTHQFHSSALVSGDCSMTGASHRGRVWERGMKLYSKVVAIDMHF